jgi:hypothetical protein
MSNIIKLLILASLALNIGACRSDKAQSQSQADQLVKESQTIGAQLNDMGFPQSKWSDEELNQYEAKLQRLEAIQKDLVDLKSRGEMKDEVEDNSEFIKTSREFLQLAREERARRNSTADNVTRVAELKKEAQEMMVELSSAGELSDTWTDADLETYVELANQLLVNLNTQKTIVQQNRSAFAGASQVIQGLEEKIKEASDVRDEARKILNDNRGQNSGISTVASGSFKAKYEFNINGCHTGKHEAFSKGELCGMLSNDSLNNFCAKDDRVKLAAKHQCG